MTALTNLDAIILRCTEGDKRSNWLPVIERLAREAAAELRAVPEPSGQDHDHHFDKRCETCLYLARAVPPALRPCATCGHAAGGHMPECTNGICRCRRFRAPSTPEPGGDERLVWAALWLDSLIADGRVRDLSPDDEYVTWAHEAAAIARKRHHAGAD